MRVRNQRRNTSLNRPIAPKMMSRANIVSTARKRWARTIWYARPSCAASSSATTSMSQAAARLMRATSTMPGTECGRITLRRIVRRPAPSVYDALRSSLGMARATSATIKMLKNTVPTTMSQIFGLSPMPSHRRNSGVSAVAGM